jgi:hypothetical protein
MPKPTQTGLSVTRAQRADLARQAGGSSGRSPVTPVSDTT